MISMYTPFTAIRTIYIIMGTGKKQVKTSSCSRYLVNLIEVALAGAKLDSKFRRRQEDINN